MLESAYLPEMALDLISTLPSTSLSVFLLITAVALIGLYHTWSIRKASDNKTDNDGGGTYEFIRSIPDFKWEIEPPIAIRPFKTKYNLTMSIENMTLDELIAVDRTYAQRINLRRSLMQDHPSTIGTRPGCEAAVHEFYTWMTRIYLPQRFPEMYSLQKSGKRSHLQNLVTSESIPLEPSSSHSALQTLGAHVDTDFLFLLPDKETGKYHLEAFVACFPSGFSTLEKLGLPLAAIHTPVPGYAAKLEKSMDRFFAKIPVGRIVRRANWSITTNDLLFAESGNHLYDHDKSKNTTDANPFETHETSVEEDVERQKAEVVVENCRLRCERQTLHRLPQTKALLFAFKTYQYTLAEIKAEGGGPELATAIDGLGEGNVPDMKFYKRGVVWGDKVKEYLLG